MTIAITLKYLHWLAPVINEDDVRSACQVVRIEPHPAGGALLIATDGHVMMVIHDARAIVDVSCSFAPSRVLLRAASAVDDSKLISLPEDYENSPLGEFRAENFVDWRRVIPTGELRGPAAFNINVAMLFRNVARAAENASGIGGAPLIVWAAPKDVGNVVTARGLPQFFGLIMGLRADSMEQPSIPQWLRSDAVMATEEVPPSPDPVSTETAA